MLLDIPGTVNFSQVQVYNNELINYVVINRGLSRLYDNDEAIATRLSAYTNQQFDNLDTRMLAVENLAGDISTIQADVAALQSNTSNYTDWNTAYSIVESNYIDWNTTYSLVSSNSALWNTAGSGSGVSYLSALNDVVVGTLGPSQDGYALVWDNTSETWQPSGVTGIGSGVTTGNVSGIVEGYDTENDWSITSTEWQANSDDVLATTTFVTTTSGDFALKTDENGYNYNSIWMNKDEGTDSASALARSFYTPVATAAYILANYDFFDTTTASHDQKQSGTIYVNVAIDDTDADLANEILTIDGNVGLGTINNLYLVMQYKAARDATFNMPDGGTTQLARISGCTFGFTDINEDNSYTTFDGFYITDSTFTGDANQKFLFKNCHIDLSNITVSTASEFHFDNSCTIDPTAIANLTVKNKGIPTYLSTGTDPSTISGSFADFTGPYLYSDALVQP